MRLARLLAASGALIGSVVGIWSDALAQTNRPVCSLSLVLAIDVSSSVDEEEYRLQMGGLAAALADPEVAAAIASVGGIQMTAFEWSGRYSQTMIEDWRFVALADDVAAFAEAVATHPRGRDDMPTALGYALGYASGLFGQAPLDCARKVIDVSGDGVNNEGFEPLHAYQAFPLDDVQINGLVIAGADPDPVSFYRREVKRGPGSFVEVATSFGDYEAAMKRKLIREILGGALSEAKTDNLFR